jgi:hypothetical protein
MGKEGAGTTRDSQQLIPAQSRPAAQEGPWGPRLPPSGPTPAEPPLPACSLLAEPPAVSGEPLCPAADSEPPLPARSPEAGKPANPETTAGGAGSAVCPPHAAHPTRARSSHQARVGGSLLPWLMGSGRTGTRW